jgi:hypothetical protein
LLLISLLVRLHDANGLQYNLHQMVLCGNQLLKIDGVVVGGAIDGLAIVLVVPCVRHPIG